MSGAHRLALAAFIALATLQVVWYGWWFPSTSLSRSAAISLALVWFALPLLAARISANAAMLVAGLISLLYFSHGVMELWANPQERVPAGLEILLSLIVVVFAGLPSWQKARARKRSMS